MMDPQKLESANLANRSTLIELTDSVREASEQLLRNEGFELLKALTQRLRTTEAEQLGPLAFEYQNLMVQLQFVAFADLDELDAVQLIRDHVVTIFQTELDLEQQLRQRLVALSIWDRDEFKKKIRDALIRNNQQLTSEPLTLGVGETQVSPTVANWIRDYTYSLGSNLNSPLAIEQYYLKNQNIARLSAEERKRVRTILGLYERFKFPSASLEGFDGALNMTVNGLRFLAAYGDITPIGLAESSTGARSLPEAPLRIGEERTKGIPADLETVSRLISQIDLLHAQEDQELYRRQEQLIGEVGSDVSALIQRIASALQSRNQAALLVALFVLIRSGTPERILEDKGIREQFYSEYVQPLAEQSHVDPTMAKMVLDRNPGDERYVSAFLHWAVKVAGSGNEAESARIGHHMTSTLTALGNTGYMNLTTFDPVTQRFLWTPIAIGPDGFPTRSA